MEKLRTEARTPEPWRVTTRKFFCTSSIFILGTIAGVAILMVASDLTPLIDRMGDWYRSLPSWFRIPWAIFGAYQIWINSRKACSRLRGNADALKSR